VLLRLGHQQKAGYFERPRVPSITVGIRLG
jgi:hypothetical protein